MGEHEDLGALLDKLLALPVGESFKTHGRFAVCKAVGEGERPEKKEIYPKIIFSGEIVIRRTDWGYQFRSEGDKHRLQTKIISNGEWKLIAEDPNLSTRTAQGWNRPYIATETPEFGVNAEARIYATFP